MAKKKRKYCIGQDEDRQIHFRLKVTGHVKTWQNSVLDVDS